MDKKTSKGTLYLVPTPIGNLDDITKRATDVLGKVDLVACEDTRVTGRLLKKFGLTIKMISYHDFNEARRLPHLLNILNRGGDLAVVSDAGSPGLSDPAYRIIRAAIENNVNIVPLPGPNALIPALTASGLPLDRFFFEGFLPQKSAARRKRLAQLMDLEHTLIFYESPYRINKTVADCLDILGDRPACLAREISKLHEEFIRGTFSELMKALGKRKLKGEIVLVIAGIGLMKKISRE
jgi:16S rRNA (cytidine1402-2'-O)-methyltransferase